VDSTQQRDPDREVEAPAALVPRFPRRAATKVNTRRRLVSSALALFAEKSYEETTVAEIATLAGAAPRTFFVHFPTKADVLFDVPAEDMALLGELIRAQPSSRTDVVALESAVTEWCLLTSPNREVRHQLARLLLQAAVTSPALRGKQLDYNQALVDLSAQALAKRNHDPSPSLVALTAAQAVIRILHAIIIDWAEHGADDLERIAITHFEALHEVFAADGPVRHSTTELGPDRSRQTSRRVRS
jgi:AcrR family transcriptional regulator